jgi:hypothetical protein
MSIDQAQQEIATDWIAAYRKLCEQSVAPQRKSVALGRARHQPRPIMMGGDNGERAEAIGPRGQEAKEDGAKEAERRQWVDL